MSGGSPSGSRRILGLLGSRGAKGIRTPDPLHAMEVRYQLRYSPNPALPQNVDSIQPLSACVASTRATDLPSSAQDACTRDRQAGSEAISGASHRFSRAALGLSSAIDGPALVPER
jgi:hypothetical protein